MKRLTACIIILTVIAAMSVFSVFAVKKENDKFISLVNAAENSYRNDDSDTAQRLEELENAWNKYYVRISYIAQSCTLDDISYAVAKLQPYWKRALRNFCQSARAYAHGQRRYTTLSIPIYIRFFNVEKIVSKTLSKCMIFSCVIVQIYKNHTEQGGFKEFFLTFLSANIILRMYE